MTGPVYHCGWWKCAGTKLVPHATTTCPHMRARNPQVVVAVETWEPNEEVHVGSRVRHVPLH